MKLDNQLLHSYLSSKDIHYLYHANTVSTTITYIEQGGILSRGAVERGGLHQTPQDSDQVDKDIDVWDDIFLDTTDLHTYFNRNNIYGPVLFKINIDFLLHEDLEIWITKDNPIYWTSTQTHTDKYFSDVNELGQLWDTMQRQRKMLTVRKIDQPILFNYVDEVIVDNPMVKVEGNSLRAQCVKALKEAVGNNSQFMNKFKLRECSSNCFCHSNYLEQVRVPKLKRLFLPK